MTTQTQTSQVKTNKNEAERAFLYNVIVPDATLLIIGLIASFGALLNIFS